MNWSKPAAGWAFLRVLREIGFSLFSVSCIVGGCVHETSTRRSVKIVCFRSFHMRWIRWEIPYWAIDSVDCVPVRALLDWWGSRNLWFLSAERFREDRFERLIFGFFRYNEFCLGLILKRIVRKKKGSNLVFVWSSFPLWRIEQVGYYWRSKRVGVLISLTRGYSLSVMGYYLTICFADLTENKTQFRIFDGLVPLYCGAFLLNISGL